MWSDIWRQKGKKLVKSNSGHSESCIWFTRVLHGSYACRHDTAKTSKDWSPFALLHAQHQCRPKIGFQWKVPKQPNLVRILNKSWTPTKSKDLPLHNNKKSFTIMAAAQTIVDTLLAQKYSTMALDHASPRVS